MDLKIRIIDNIFIIFTVVLSVKSGQYIDKIGFQKIKNIRTNIHEIIKWYFANFHITCFRRCEDVLLA